MVEMHVVHCTKVRGNNVSHRRRWRNELTALTLHESTEKQLVPPCANEKMAE